MKLLLLTVMIWATASARPEMYRENEDFQYSRSSTDEGSKSGYYGAQRGNMGGNYEKAHNMDGLAQHQMSGLVGQVDGELGEGHNTRTGDVFAAANSRGSYGSGKYDLRNLQGRNFGEGTHVGDSQSHSSVASHSSGYSGQSSHSSEHSGANQLQKSGYSGYKGSYSDSHGLQSSNLQSQDNMHSASAYGAREQSEYNSGHYAQSAYQGQGSYGSSNTNQYSSNAYPQNRLIWTVPVKIVGRPGSRVAVPVGVQTYDATHSGSTFDQNAINSEAESLNNSNNQFEYKPSNSARRYESSYNYRKQWEKHDTQPEVVVLSMPTENTLPQNSELHEDTASLHSQNRYHASNSHKSNVQSGYNTNSESSQSNHQSGYNSQYHSGTNLNAYTQDTHTTRTSDGANFVSDVNSKPKSYHSSYAYHKSWERQGDPYEIKPVGEGTTRQESQRLTSATKNQGFASNHYDNQHHQSHQSYSSQNGLDDCVEHGHVRVTRSVGQQSRSNLIDLGNLGQHTQDLTQDFDRPERTQTWNDNFRRRDQDFNKQDLGQQSENLGQQSLNNWGQGFDKLEESGQQSQDLGQQSQNSWGSGFDKLEDLGQQSQDLGQQTQNGWGQSFDKLEDLGQQSQNLGQQTQNEWGQGLNKLEDLGQQSQNLGQQTHNEWGQGINKQEDLGQQSQDLGQQTHTGWGQGLNKQEIFEQQTRNLEQRTQNSWGQGFDKGEDLRSQKDLPQQSVNQWDDLQNLGQQSQSNYNPPSGVDNGLEPPPPIQDTGPAIQAWTPVEHQHKSQLLTPTVKSQIPVPVLDVYISVNPNMNKYTKYNDQTFEASTISNDFTINEYLNQQNKNIWSDENDIIHKNIDNRQIKPGPVHFLKGSQEPHRNPHKPSEIFPKLPPYFYRGHINPARSNPLHRANGGQHQFLNSSIQQTHKSDEQLQARNYSMQQIQAGYYDGANRDHQKYSWRTQDTNRNTSYNSTDLVRDKSNQLEHDSTTKNLGISFFDDTPGFNAQLYTQNGSQHNKSNPLETKLPVIKLEAMTPDEVVLNTHHAKSQILSFPMFTLKGYKSPKEKPEIHSNPLYRPNLNNNQSKAQILSGEDKLTVKHAQDINDQPEVYPDLKVKKKKLKLKKKKLNTLEKVSVEQKNLDDLIEQRDDLSQEIWEQNFINLGKERNIGQGQEKKLSSKEQSEEVPSMWDQNMNQEKGNPTGSQWHNHIEHLNMSLQKLRYHKQAVEEFIYANTGSIPLYDNPNNQTKNFSRLTNKTNAGDTRAIELAYLKEIQGTTIPPPPPPIEEHTPERVHSPLWNAMESYYSFAKDIIVSWFD